MEALNEADRRICGAAVRRAREGRGWSRRQLAEESGVGETTIKDIENGATPHDDTIAKILDALGVEMTSFGLMTPWMADQITALVQLAQYIPRERLPEVIGAIMQVMGRAARNRDLEGFGFNPNITQVVFASEADVDQHNN
ncbi:helix-turn-helix domain-containing protein [Mycolicibacterium sphagni]|uniref:HTH cro/C1-type domain-containing protein n=1 Tax=Mycolicibacterium sphagni TaxID=1786 RepID=A0A255DDZ4_9MYCO|nr:helix-turn-helix transcriptional regulator [Mycolicibacterium sphagni]OYN76851.1 hypothetical protein CG716_20270 [Mycolicibacterium sphagni]